MSEDVHANIAAIQKMEVASDRLARSVNERLPSIHRELRMVSEALDERRNELQHKVSSLRDEISSADEDEDTSWARRSLEEAEESLTSVERRRRRLSETSAVFTAQARKMENLATDHAIRTREFLRGTVDDLKAYFAETNTPFSIGNDAAIVSGTNIAITATEAASLVHDEAQIAAVSSAIINGIHDSTASNEPKNECVVFNTAMGGIQFGVPGDGFLAFASKAVPVDGMLDVAVHGSPRLVDIGGKVVNHRVMAKLIEQHSEFTGQKIRLLSCEAGKLSNGFAQNLANRLGVSVHAPNDIIWAFRDGSLTIGPTPFENSGEFIEFSPGGGRQ